jgi:L-ribulokinase
VLIPERPITSLGSALFAFVASGVFASLEDAQAKLCPTYRVIEPDGNEHATYERLYAMFRKLYFAMGSPESNPVHMGTVLPALRRIAADVRRST